MNPLPKPTLRFLPAGDGALVIELGNAIDAELNARVRALDLALARDPFDGYLEAVPTYRSLLVSYDSRRCTFAAIRQHVAKLGTKVTGSKPPQARTRRVPVVYDGEDLEEVARTIGTSAEEVVRLHSEREYLVYMVGFTPGFAYMAETDPKLAIPRRATPRTRVPAGSVAIAMGQTGIYPSPTPGGWHLLGRAEHRTLFDLNNEPPSFFVSGDRVRFVPVDTLPELVGAAPNRVGGATPSRFSALVEDGGLLTTIQDLGRFGYQRYGVPVAGAMDATALRAANQLVGNDPGAAALECTVDGPRLRFVETAVVAIAGADLAAVVERSDLGRWRVPPWSSFLVRQGNTLRFEGRRTGTRAYIAFAGGIDVPDVLGSRSTYLTGGFGGYEGRPLRAGDRLGAGPIGKRVSPGARLSAPPQPSEAVLRAILGPQDDHFTKQAVETLASASYTVGAASDRMGYRLEGPILPHAGPKEIVSDGMVLGAIQVPPNGLPIVMMADRATTGGYPKIATVTSADISKLAQLVPGDRVRFEPVGLDEARAQSMTSP